MDIQTILNNNNLDTIREYYDLIIENLRKNGFTSAETQFNLMEVSEQNKFLHYVWDSHDFWGLNREQTNAIIHFLD